MFSQISLISPVKKADLDPKLVERDKPIVYNDEIENEINIFTRQYDEDEFIEKNYKKIFVLAHPFENMHLYIKSDLINSDNKIEITNAYMKMYVFLTYMSNYILKRLIKNNTLTLYDVAGAPGMFVFATNYFCNKRDIKLDWYTCSLEKTPDNKALEDNYGLYKNNPDRYMGCDVTKKKDIENILKSMKKRKFSLVTGDIGSYFDKYDVLQEFEQLDLEWGQMVLSLNLVEEGGIMFLKMYSLITQQSLLLLDTLACFFEKVYICKPRTSRLLNFESYIMCINRNSEDCSDISLTRPNIEEYISQNQDIVLSFERLRNQYKLRISSVIVEALKKNINITPKQLSEENEEYKMFYNENGKIYRVLLRQNTDQNLIKKLIYKFNV